MNLLPESIHDLESYKFLQAKWMNVRKVQHDDFTRIAELEVASYDVDDAASPDTIQFRMKESKDYFYVLLNESNNNKIIGFINGTCCNGDKLKHETITQHDKSKYINLGF